MGSRKIALAGALVLGIGVGWARTGEGRQAPRPSQDRGRYSDPYLGVHTWPGATTGNQALFYFLAARRQEAERAQAEGPASAGTGVTSGSPYFRMTPGGSTAGSYFGRTTVVRPDSGRHQPARYNRYGHYFGNLGR